MVPPLSDTPGWSVPFAVIFQELFRYVYYRLLKYVHFSIQINKKQKSSNMKFLRLCVGYSNGEMYINSLAKLVVLLTVAVLSGFITEKCVKCECIIRSITNQIEHIMLTTVLFFKASNVLVTIFIIVPCNIVVCTVWISPIQP